MDLNFHQWILLLYQVSISVIMPFSCVSQTTDSVAPESGSIRLANGTESAGRVEIYLNGEWGTVCDDGWGFDDALVVCRQLGFAGALGAFRRAYFFRGVGAIHMDEVQCLGDEESLAECSHNRNHDCNHSEDAGVVCWDYEYVEVSLVGGNGTYGQVELNLDGDWKRVCGDYWSLAEADAVCRHIGLKGAAHAKSISIGSANETDEGLVGIPANETILYDVDCHGNESSIVKCRIGRVDSCLNYAVVECVQPEEGTVRLADGPDTSAGRVEIYHDDQWGTVCDNEWRLSAASVVCAQLGFRGVIAAPKLAPFGEGTGAIHLATVECGGLERALLDCDISVEEEAVSGVSASDLVYLCDHSDDAGAVCVSEDDGALRLVDGATNSSGRVEVFLWGLWGTVCDDQFDITDAIVVCRQLGFLGALEVLERTDFRIGTGPIHLDNLGCLGNEETLLECSFVNIHNCRHQEDVGVSCVRQDDGQLRLVGGVDEYSGRVEVFINDTWRRVCDDGWDDSDAGVACRQLGFGGAVRHDDPFFSFGSGGGDFILGGLRCNGTESHLVACPTDTGRCREARDATAVCELSSFGTFYPVRLTDNSTMFAGTVEVFFGGRWGTVCDSAWDMEDSTVICNQLGFGDAVNVSIGRGTTTELRDRPILLSDLRCHGNETNLSECYFTFGARISNDSCRRENDVYVVCADACLQHIRCPDDMAVTLESRASRNSSEVTWPTPSVKDNPCGAVSFNSSHSPGDSFHEGITTVSYQFRDTSEKVVECNFTVRVTREEEIVPGGGTDTMYSASFLPAVISSLVVIVALLALCAFAWWVRAPFCKGLRRRPLPARPDILVSDFNPAYLPTTRDGMIKEFADPLPPRPDVLFTSFNPAYIPTTGDGTKDHKEGIYDLIPGRANTETENDYYITPIGAERKTSTATLETVSLSSLSSLETDQRLSESSSPHAREPHGSEGDVFGLADDASVDVRMRKKKNMGVVSNNETDQPWRKRINVEMSRGVVPENSAISQTVVPVVPPRSSFVDDDPYGIYASRIDAQEVGGDTSNSGAEVGVEVEPLPRDGHDDQVTSDASKEKSTENLIGSLRDSSVFIMDIGNF